MMLIIFELRFLKIIQACGNTSRHTGVRPFHYAQARKVSEHVLNSGH